MGEFENVEMRRCENREDEFSDKKIENIRKICWGLVL